MGFRRLAAVLMLAALVAGTSTAFAGLRHPAAVRGTNTIVSQGSGRQVLEGAGLTYGTLAPGGVVRFIDLSPRHDAKYTVTAQVPASGANAAQSIQVKPVKIGGMLVFKFGKNPKQTAKASLAFSVAGSRFRLALEGTSVLNGAAVVARVALEGSGTIAVNGQNPPVDWLAAGRVTLAAHPVVQAKPTPPVTTAPTTTS